MSTKPTTFVFGPTETPFGLLSNIFISDLDAGCPQFAADTKLGGAFDCLEGRGLAEGSRWEHWVTRCGRKFNRRETLGAAPGTEQ